MQGIRGKNVLITGSSSGIGQSIAINFRTSVAEAEMTHEQMHAAMDQVNQHGGVHILIQADVSKEDDVIRMIETTIKELGGLDILINNAGIQTPIDSHEMTTASFDRVIGVNLRGAFMCAREAIKHFLAQNKPGAIVNVSSVHQVIPKPRFLS